MMWQATAIISLGFFWLIATVTKIITEGATRRRLLETRPSDEVARALLRKGYDPDLFGTLKWGLVLASIGAGLIAIQNLPVDESEPMAVGVVLICAGSGMLLYYLVATLILKVDPRGRIDLDGLDAPPPPRPFDEP